MPFGVIGETTGVDIYDDMYLELSQQNLATKASVSMTRDIASIHADFSEQDRVYLQHMIVDPSKAEPPILNCMGSQIKARSSRYYGWP